MQNNFRIGVCVDLKYSYGQKVMAGISSYAQKNTDIEPVILDTTPIDRELVESLRLDGIISDLCRDDSTKEIVCPTIDVASSRPRADVPVISTDDVEVGWLAAEMFHKAGFSNLVKIAVKNRSYAKDRVQGFLDYCTGNELPKPKVFWMDSEQLNWDFEQLESVLDSLPVPSGIFASSDILAAHVWKVAQRLNRKIPHDWAILGVGDDGAIRRLHQIDLSSIAQNEHTIGWSACESLSKWLKSGEKPTDMLVSPGVLVVRSSTMLFPLEDTVAADGIRWLHENYNNPDGLSPLLDTLNMSRRTFERRFRKSLKTSPYSELKRIRLSHAKTLLSGTSNSLMEIAHELGYSEQSELSKDFRRSFGEPPSVWRARNNVEFAE